jgi:hypothetical protein
MHNFSWIKNYNIVINNVGQKITILQFIFNNYSIFKIKFSRWFEFNNENNNIKYIAETIIKFSYYYFPEAPKKIHYFLSKMPLGKFTQKISYQKQFKFIKTASEKNKINFQFLLLFWP